MVKNSIIGVMGIVILLLLYRSCRQGDKIEEIRDFYSDVIDTITTSKTKLGKAHRTSVIQNEKLLMDLQSRDTAIIVLQDAITYYRKKLAKVGSSVTVFEVETKVDTQLIVEIDSVEVIKDSIRVDTVERKQLSFYDKYVALEVMMIEDSAKLFLQVRDNFVVAIGEEGFWKKKRFVEVTNNNPYSSLNYLKTYSVKQPKRKWFSVGVQAGYGLDLIDLQPRPYIGIGIQFNLINF